MKPPKSTGHKYDAILSLDPAGSQNCGLALRGTSGLEGAARGKLRPPAWYADASVWDPPVHDQLAEELMALVPKGGRVLLVAENAAYKSMIIARSLGKCIGAVQVTLLSLNVWSTPDTQYITPSAWRRDMLPAAVKDIGEITNAQKRRAYYKEAAIRAVAGLYGIETGDNAAEAILLNDHVVLSRKDLWANALP